ncbi:MAG: antibiotic biosynthesis monooxygenase [Chloroflexi bacterium]|nr:antibiotic biosynthesis monooxygenase [Chloroflexota bacterium]
MIVELARLKIKPGKGAEAEQALREMAEAVEAQEPGVLVYLSHRSQKHPSEIVFFEIYADEDAYSAHFETPHIVRWKANLGPVFDPGSLEVERVDRVTGFSRPPA